VRKKSSQEFQDSKGSKGIASCDAADLGRGRRGFVPCGLALRGRGGVTAAAVTGRGVQPAMDLAVDLLWSVHRLFSLLMFLTVKNCTGLVC
jgi:hypothetical protein